MRKLLSILASVGLVATASTSVVACSKSDGVDNKTNNPSHTYEQFEKWAKQSESGTTELVFIGGRTDSDSLSWLAARGDVATNSDTNTADYKGLINTKNVDDLDAKFNAKINGSDSGVKTYNNLATENDPTRLDSAGDVKNWFWKDGDKAGTVPDKLELHSILVDDISKFWTNGIGSTGIIKKFITDQAKSIDDFAHSPSWNGKPMATPAGSKESTDDIKKEEVKLIVKSITSSLASASNKGPYFLVINNGKIAGITEGFKNYSTFNSDLKNDNTDGTNLTKQQAFQDMNDFFYRIYSNVWQQLITWIQGNWMPNTTASSFTVTNASNDGQVDWTKLAGLNKKYDQDTANKKPAPTPTPDTGNGGSDDSGKGKTPDNSGDKNKTQKTYKLDINKYID